MIEAITLAAASGALMGWGLAGIMAYSGKSCSCERSEEELEAELLRRAEQRAATGQRRARAVASLRTLLSAAEDRGLLAYEEHDEIARAIAEFEVGP